MKCSQKKTTWHCIWKICSIGGVIEMRSRTYHSTSLNLTVSYKRKIGISPRRADVSFHITYASKRQCDVSFHIMYASERHSDVSFHITYVAKCTHVKRMNPIFRHSLEFHLERAVCSFCNIRLYSFTEKRQRFLMHASLFLLSFIFLA